ncbi:phosphatase PAP2 family protein [Patescibacteria group bacterium]|nr:phosphatase PAP2 family protein [Patescibacteria group bacterium]MCL5798388.1 phosphatase PAP2 family protein [Patescibacteria group bacterium]
MNGLLLLDRDFFILINHLPHNLFLDYFFAFFSGLGTWGLVWVLILSVLVVWEEIEDKKGLWALIFSIVFILIFVESGIKNIVRRLRPEMTIPSTIVVFDLEHSYSFPSVHSTIAFAAAYIMAKEHKRWAAYYYILAILIAFSRIYLGKHYPSDVLAGAVLGSLIGFFFLNFVKKYMYAKAKVKTSKKRKQKKVLSK